MDNPSIDTLTGKTIGAAIAVHRSLGPGFLESIYEEALVIELGQAHLRAQRQLSVPVTDRNQRVGEHRLDLLVEDAVVVELKTVERFEDVHYAIVRSYLKATGTKRGLLMNFASTTLQVKRIGPECRILP